MSRAIVFLLVVAMHLLVLSIGLLERATKSSPLGGAAQRVLVMVDRDEERRDLRLNAPHPSITRPRPSLFPETLLIPNSPTNELAAAPIDWRAEGEKAAKEIIRSASERKPMAQPPPTPVKDVPTSTVFGSLLENRRAGKAEIIENVQRVFVTDNCYFEFEFARGAVSPELELARTDIVSKSSGRVSAPICVQPPTGGGANMFKDLTPKYLEQTYD